MQYEENRDRLKLCALCDNRIEKDKTVCQKHMPELELYRNELWFQELCRMQQRQYEIDLEEFIMLKKGKLPSLAEKSAKPRTKLTELDRLEIIKLNNKGIGRIKIAKTLNLSVYAVDKYLVRYKRYLRKVQTFQQVKG